MRFSRAYVKWILGMASILALAACGGGGGGSTSSGTAGTVTVQGAVPGTVFVAVDDGTNMEVARVTATGTPKSFSMALPTGTEYRFYVMENEGTGNSRIYPMYIGSSNVFGIDNSADGQTIALGMITPDLATGHSIPANTPGLMMAHGTSGAVPASLSGSAFSMTNMTGTSWAYNAIATSGTMAWEHGTLSFDNSALGHMTGIVRNGNSLPDRNGIPYQMSLSGMLQNQGDPTFQCVVSRDRTVMVGTFTDNTGGPAMMIAQRRGGTFPTDASDLTGSWRFQRFTAGSDNTTSGWAYGTMQMTAGSATITSMTTNAGTGTTGNFAFVMDANGIVTDPADASFHGAMSLDRTMIVATDTDGGYPEMWILIKDTQATISLADMAGDWVMHAVSSGNVNSRGWTYGQSVADASGNDSFFGMMGNTGPVSDTQMSFTMGSGGVMTMGGGTSGGMMGGGSGSGMMSGGMMGGGVNTSTFHGVTNGARNIMVSTYTDGNGGYPFTIQLK